MPPKKSQQKSRTAHEEDRDCRKEDTQQRHETNDKKELDNKTERVEAMEQAQPHHREKLPRKWEEWLKL